MQTRSFLSVCFAGAVLLAGNLRGMTNLVSGPLTRDVTWSGTNVLRGTVSVPPGIVVTIDPGTTLWMDTGATLVVRGQLLANGTAAEPIHFTRYRAGTSWERIQFIGAASSRLRHCVIEYANSAGTHLDYYDNDCQVATTPPPRIYHEAVIVVASQVEIDGCVFQNLPSDSGTKEGDAIAVISDDPETPGAAFVQIRNSRFLSIGQGVHARYSYVLVENCFFTDHRGDNDDVDLYGESIPPPLIRNNIFLNPNHDDMINPTKCSAIIVGNVISGSDDHGVVLRDKCSPIVMNNVIYNCASAGIAVQNQCDALLLNNTIVNCGRGIRFFDHTARWGPPYCLAPGSGKATVINCIIWDCPTPLLLTDSPSSEDGGSHATVLHCNIEGGRASASVSANSTLTWGNGNFNSDPQFTSDYRLRSGSPCIDKGTNANVILTNLNVTLSTDRDGTARPLDGNGDGLPAFDIGAYEYLLATADSNGDGIPDGWIQQHGLNPIDPTAGAANPDQDGHTTIEEWVADTDPTNAHSYFHIERIESGAQATLSFLSSSKRQYTLFYATNLSGLVWNILPGQVDVVGSGNLRTLVDMNPTSIRFYRVGVKLLP